MSEEIKLSEKEIEDLEVQMKMIQLYAPSEKQCLKVLNNWCLVLGGDEHYFSQKDVNKFVDEDKPLIQLILAFYLHTSEYFFKNCCPEDWDDYFKKGIIQNLGKFLVSLRSSIKEERKILEDIGQNIYGVINMPKKLYKNEDQFQGIWYKMLNYLLESKESIILNNSQQ